MCIYFICVIAKFRVFYSEPKIPKKIIILIRKLHEWIPCNVIKNYTNLHKSQMIY